MPDDIKCSIVTEHYQNKTRVGHQNRAPDAGLRSCSSVSSRPMMYRRRTGRRVRYQQGGLTRSIKCYNQQALPTPHQSNRGRLVARRSA
ncbi:MAG: hypothetical protein CBB71_03595 [Rhodopirellula sp. TMED11]|nr:MAG: hypothetical protein CBB71_03595 [Rhodopirellula sp. TMED11]